MKTLENKIIVSKGKEKKVKQKTNKQILPKFPQANPSPGGESTKRKN